MNTWTSGRIIRMVIRIALLIAWVKLATVSLLAAGIVLAAVAVIVGLLMVALYAPVAFITVAAEVILTMIFGARFEKSLVDSDNFHKFYFQAWAEALIWA